MQNGARHGDGDMLRRLLDGLYLFAGYAAGAFLVADLRHHDGDVGRAAVPAQHSGRRRFRLLVHGRDGVPRSRAHVQARRDDPRRPAARKARTVATSRSPRSLALGVAAAFIALLHAPRRADDLRHLALQRHGDRRAGGPGVDSAARIFRRARHPVDRVDRRDDQRHHAATGRATRRDSRTRRRRNSSSAIAQGGGG